MGSSGLLDATLSPVETHFNEAGMCVVNVHWHLGAEHKNVGTYDIDGEEWMEQHGKTKPKGHGANVVPGHGYGYGNVKGAVPRRARRHRPRQLLPRLRRGVAPP